MSRLLLADDEETYALTTVELFRSSGHVCDRVRSGHEAIGQIEGDDYDVLVTDIAMPGGDDLSFLAELHERAPTVPVVVVTGYPSLRTATQAVRIGAVDYLVKPVAFDELLAAVERAAEQGEALCALRSAAGRCDELRELVDRLGRGSCVCPRHLFGS